MKLPQVPKRGDVLALIPDELAIAITLSSNQSDYFYDLVVNRFNVTFTPRFYQSFIGRLLIEKPDFNSNRSTGLALLWLYNLSIESMMVAQEGITILRDYEKLLEISIQSDVRGLMLDNYDYVGERKVQSYIVEEVGLKPRQTRVSSPLTRGPFLPERFFLPSFVIEHPGG